MITAEIILLYNELSHDVEAELHRIENNRKPSSPDAGSALDVLGSDYEYTLRREIDSALAAAVARMQAYLVLPSPFAKRISTNHAHPWEEKNILLSMPDNWPPHCIDTLQTSVHAYIVKTAVLKLLSQSAPDDRYIPLLTEQQQRAYNDINAAVSFRLGPTRIHPTPFG